MSNKTNKYRGITLLETIIYLALFAVIFIAIVEFYFMMARNNRIAQEKVEIQKVVLFINQHFSESFDDVESIDVDNSVFDDNNGSLRILKDSSYIEYSLNSTKIIVDNNGEVNNISPNSIEVLSLRFEEILDSEDNNVGVRVFVNLESEDYDGISEEIITSFVIF